MSYSTQERRFFSWVETITVVKATTIKEDFPEPHQVGGLSKEEVELSKELTEAYELEEKPGFKPTDVSRKSE